MKTNLNYSHESTYCLHRRITQVSNFFINLPLLVARVVGLCAGTRCGVDFLGTAGAGNDTLGRTATGDEDSFCTTPFFLAAVKSKVLVF